MGADSCRRGRRWPAVTVGKAGLVTVLRYHSNREAETGLKPRYRNGARPPAGFRSAGSKTDFPTCIARLVSPSLLIRVRSIPNPIPPVSGRPIPGRILSSYLGDLNSGRVHLASPVV